MPGVKPPVPAPPNPFDDVERELIRAEVDDLLPAAEPSSVPVERVRRVVGNLLDRGIVSGDELTEARMLASRLRSDAPDVAALLTRLAHRRSVQVRDREPAWIMGNPASELYQGRSDK